jgi:hypothetical protein
MQPPNLTCTNLTTAANLPKASPTYWPNNSAQNSFNKTASKPTKSIKNQEFEERRLKGLCFWYDDKFVLGHRCRNKRLYSLSIINEEEEIRGEKRCEEGCLTGELIPKISLNTLEWTVGFHTMKVTGKVGK